MKNNIVNQLLNLLKIKGADIQYGNEDVTQLEHALQCAELAEQNKKSDAFLAQLRKLSGSNTFKYGGYNKGWNCEEKMSLKFISLNFKLIEFKKCLLIIFGVPKMFPIIW